MRRDKIEIYVHLLWTTWDREKLIIPSIEKSLHRTMAAVVERHDSRVIRVNGVADHVHLLIKIASTTLICDLVKEAKGASSREANLTVGNFRWRPTYAAFSVSRWDVDMVSHYIAKQKRHHAAGDLDARFEEFDEEYTFHDDCDGGDFSRRHVACGEASTFVDEHRMLSAQADTSGEA